MLTLGSAPVHAAGLVAAENVPVSLPTGAPAASMSADPPADSEADDNLSLGDLLNAPAAAPPRQGRLPSQAAAGTMREPDAYALVVIGLLAVGAALLRHSRNRQPGRRGLRR